MPVLRLIHNNQQVAQVSSDCVPRVGENLRWPTGQVLPITNVIYDLPQNPVTGINYVEVHY